MLQPTSCYVEDTAESRDTVVAAFVAENIDVDHCCSVHHTGTVEAWPWERAAEDPCGAEQRRGRRTWCV